MTSQTEPDIIFSEHNLMNLGTKVRAAYDKLSKDGVPPEAINILFTGEHEFFGDAVVLGGMYDTPAGEYQAPLLMYGILKTKGNLDGGSFEKNFSQHGEVLVYRPGQIIE
jgi:hypothetical protein